MADLDTNWTWNFSGSVSSSKAQSRPSLPKETAWDLVGFDGNHVGGLRPHPGFTKIDTFTVQGTLVNVFPVTFLRGATNYGYGHVLVYTRSGSTYFDLRGYNGSGFTTVNLRTIAATSLEVDVQTIGRFIFCFARGYAPSLHYTNDTGGITVTSVNPAGPGAAPTAASIATNHTGATAPTNAQVYASQTTDLQVLAWDKSTYSGNTLSKGRYSFAVQYMSTTTGRKTQISKNTEVFVWESATGSSYTGEVYFSVGYKAGYDKALIYRTVNQGTSGTGGYSGAPMHLEAIVNVPGSGSYTVASVTNKDRVLVYKDVYVERGNLETEMPKGGVAQFLDGTLLISRISGAPTTPSETTPLAPPSGLGELRWSSLLETLPENFSPFGRWVPQTPGNEVIGMRKVGSFMIGFGQDRIYHIRRQGAFARIEEMHPGFGLASTYGLESVGNLVYFVSNKGLKAISAEGQIDDVLGLNQLILQNWVGTVSQVNMAYDANTMCLYTYRPTQTETGATGHAALMWFSTSRLTELVDLPFKFLRGGNWNNASGRLERRAIFYKPQCALSAARVGAGYQEWAAFVPTSGSNETSRNKMLLGDNARFAAYDELNDGGFSHLDPSGETSGDANFYACAGYVTSISSYNENIATIRVGDKVALTNIATGFNEFAGMISPAPVYMRWTGSNLGTEFQPGAGEYKEFFKDKQVSSVGCYVEYNLSTEPITLDSGSPSTPVVVPYWMCELYRGSRPIGPEAPGLVDNQPTAGPAYPFTRLTSANATPTIAKCFGPTITDPEDVPNASFGKHGVVGSSLSPSWVCFWPGVDITLLALSLKGKILDTDRRFV